jgi:hypothetical protein
MNSLAACGLEEFSVVVSVFWFWQKRVFVAVAENSFCCYFENHLCHCVSFLVEAGNIFFGCTASKKNSYWVS